MSETSLNSDGNEISPACVSDTENTGREAVTNKIIKKNGTCITRILCFIKINLLTWCGNNNCVKLYRYRRRATSPIRRGSEAPARSPCTDAETLCTLRGRRGSSPVTRGRVDRARFEGSVLVLEPRLECFERRDLCVAKCHSCMQNSNLRGLAPVDSLL